MAKLSDDRFDETSSSESVEGGFLFFSLFEVDPDLTEWVFLERLGIMGITGAVSGSSIFPPLWKE